MSSRPVTRARGVRTVALVAAHFPPSNLAGVHRARLLAQHLEEFGWRPIIVTTHWRHYEEALDWDLASMVAPDLEIIRTPALPTRPIRVVGDIGVRAFAWHLRAISHLLKAKRIDFLHVTVPSFYSALLGSALFKCRPIPFGIDYIDPWIHYWTEEQLRSPKARISARLADRLEPIAVRHASLITGVAPGYYAGVLSRHPELEQRCATAAMPYGSSEVDFEAAIALDKKPYLFDPHDGCFHMLYAGALLPKAWSVLEVLLEGLAVMKKERSDIYGRIRLHFVGTGKAPTATDGHNVLPLARRIGVAEVITEHPHRMAYADVLTHLRYCAAPFILGSTEAHYTPSKVFQAVQSRRWVFALLHEASAAVQVLERSGAGMVITLGETQLPTAELISERLSAFVDRAEMFNPDTVNWAAFDGFSARESARQMAAALDAGLATFQRRTQASWSD
jgi:hypothetical protein